MSIEVNFLFVYGRLREHYASDENLDVTSLITIPVRTTGKLYDYDGDAVLIEDKDSNVYGNLILSSDMKIMLRHTDSFMEFNENNYEDSKFIRGIKDVYIENVDEKIKAWCYVYPSSRKGELEKNGIHIESGDWLEYKRKLAEGKENKNVEK